MIKNVVNWKVFWVLFIASIFGGIAVLPYAFSLQEDLLTQIPFPLPLFILFAVVQISVLFFVAILVGLVIAKKIGFGAPILQRWAEKKEVKTHLSKILAPSIGLGVIAGSLILLGDYLLLIIADIQLSLPSHRPPLWQGFLGSFYGGINEEILLRLCFMSILIWLFIKIKRQKNNTPTPFMVWIAISIAAVFFGILHLPMTSAITAITPAIIVRAVLLNGIGGVIFGWLYWKKGLESAMISHFSANMILHVVFPFVQLLF